MVHLLGKFLPIVLAERIAPALHWINKYRKVLLTVAQVEIELMYTFSCMSHFCNNYFLFEVIFGEVWFFIRRVTYFLLVVKLGYSGLPMSPRADGSKEH